MDWQELIYPELKAFDREERQVALREARGSNFDSLESIAIVCSVVLASSVTGHWMPAITNDRFLSTVLTFVVAIPLIGIMAGGFMVRRTRRGLREKLDRHR